MTVRSQPVDAVHQFLPSFRSRDAVGAHTRHVAEVIRGLGLDSAIYAFEAPEPGGVKVHPYRSFGAAPRPGTVLLYQLSTGSPVADYVLSRPEPKAVNYHNVTPPRLFAPWERDIATELAQGRAQLDAFARQSRLGIAVSGFNEAELRLAGFPRTVVAPVLFDLDSLEAGVDGATAVELERGRGRGGADWLFVGRLAPNKSQHDVVKAFAAYRRAYDGRARLHLVGDLASKTYERALRRLVDALGLADAVNFAGSVPAGALAAYYQTADVFVCLSEHEGFCVPLIEAMRQGVPVVAYDAAAVGETLAGAGVLLRAKSPLTVAATVDRVVSDAGLRAELVSAGRARAVEFSLNRARTRFREIIESLVAEPA